MLIICRINFCYTKRTVRHRIGAKDISLACEQAKEMGLDAAVFEAANSTFRRAIEMGLGESEMATLARCVFWCLQRLNVITISNTFD